MNKNGFLLIEVLLGIFLLGIVCVTYLPMFSLAQNNFYLLEVKNDMKFFAETIMERIKAFDYSNEETGYILDMGMTELFDLFYTKATVEITLPISDAFECKYDVIIIKKSKTDNLWDITVKVISKGNRERIKDVEFKALLPKPKKES